MIKIHTTNPIVAKKVNYVTPCGEVIGGVVLVMVGRGGVVMGVRCEGLVEGTEYILWAEEVQKSNNG